MFGKDDKKKGDLPPTTFEMEIALKGNPSKKKELIHNMQERLESTKKFLREGSNADDFKQMGFVLHGYASFIKVIERIN